MVKRKRIQANGGALVVILLASTIQFGNHKTAIAQLGKETEVPWEQISVLSDREISESSGLVLSQRNENCFWTHNDSGDAPRLFLIHRDGRTIARLKVAGAKAFDWEDIAFATIDGIPRIIIGDIGGNAFKRDCITLHVLSEPKFSFDDSKPARPIESLATVETAIDIFFKGGVTNYEGIAVDHAANSILIFEKSIAGRVFSVPIPDLTSKKVEVEAKLVGQTSIPFASACDISSDSKSMVVLTYRSGFLFTRSTNEDGVAEDWTATFNREPIEFSLPKMRQPEAVCFSKDSKSIYLTSEGLPTPLYKLQMPVAK